MHLKELTLRGFKSFATATQLTFEPGINAVVGPNGSGKSNVVDALSWVMGEQGAKTLRGGSMADVIFAGTSSRPPLGRAEVSLTIDNSDGALPIEYTEVTISRTLFRSGGSEYAINGSPVRLLDIQELLSDTGMGREMHVIVGQGRLDSVLQATPEERRFFIEEAAGVLKHRRRKDRALRKLESMSANLNRLADLTTELRRQLGPLARQAEAARTAQVVQAEARDARARLLADDVAQMQARLSSARDAEESLRAERDELRARRTEAREKVQELEAQAATSHPIIADLTELWQRLSTQAERFSSLQSLADERHRSLSRVEETARRETPEQILLRARAAAEEELSLAEAAENAGRLLTAAIEKREEAEKRERAIDRNLSDLNRVLADHREDSARRTGKIVTVTSRIESLTEERERVSAGRAEAEARVSDAQRAVAAAEADIVAADGGQDDVTLAYEELSAQVAAAKEDAAAARDRRDEARGTRDVTETRARTLEQSLAPDDGSDGVLSEVPGITGWLREHIDVASGWEAAVEAALGPYAGALMAEDVDVAIAALRHVGDRATVALAIAGSDSGAVDDSARAALDGIDPADGVLATDVVRSDWAPLSLLLSGVVLAADLSLARTLLANGAQRVVTRSGDILSAHAARGGGNVNASILARQSAARAASEAAKAAEIELARAEKEVRAAAERLAEIEGRFEEASGAMHARDAKLAAATAQLGVLRQTLASATAEVERNTARLSRIDTDLAARREERAALIAEDEARTTDPSDLQAKIEELSAQKASAHTRAVEARTNETEARLAVRIAEERHSVVRGKSESLKRHARAEEARLAAEERSRRKRAHDAGVAKQVGQIATDVAAKVATSRDLAAQLRRQAEEERAGADVALSAARASLDEIAAQLSDVDAALSKRDVAAAEHRVILDQLLARARDELSMDGDELIAEYGPLVDVPGEDGDRPYVRAEQEDRLAKAERKLARLGTINPLALEEHAALEERHRYLSDQLDDLRSSKNDLLKIVADIDDRVETVLESAFTDVQAAFKDVFATLFPGGEGNLVITGDDTLGAGIDIEARPPGKKVKRLSLLSGGERSLTALAFLVAIFKARPSPFYVLDEVEAALDDTNLSRMLTLFQELRDSSQLIVITHQKRTMEIADTIYGVAMKEQGVTTVISQRLADLRE